MISKLLKTPSADVKAISWPRNAAAAGKPMPTHAERGGRTDEASQLRAQIATLSANSDAQAKAEFTKGFQAGQAAIRQEIENQVVAVLERLATAAGEVAAARVDTIRRAEADTVRLSIEIARRILHRELSLDTGALESLIKAALEKLQAQEVYRVRVHPDQAAVMRRCIEHVGRSQAIEVIQDPLQPKGGVIFEISRGTLDASVDTQLREIERGLTDQLENRI